VTGIIPCFNEERHIAACIESMLWCDEIIIVDSYSTDRTPEIAQRYEKVRFFQRKYHGGASQKNWAINQSQYEWIFILDADERCTPELRAEIESILLSGARYNAYTLPRRVYFLGRVIRYSGWQHDRVTRLFRRGRAWYRNRRVHEPLATDGPAPLLRNALLHYMVDSLEEYIDRLTRYGREGAAQCWVDGKKSGPVKILCRTMWRFLRTYGLQLGFLDGTRGVVFCLVQSYSTYVKWSLVWSWRCDASGGRQPALPDFDDDPEVWAGLERLEARIASRPVPGGRKRVEAE